MHLYCIEMKSPTSAPIVKVGSTRDWKKRIKDIRRDGHRRLKANGNFKVWETDRIWYRENEIKKMLGPYLVWGSECFNIDFSLVVRLIDFYVTWPVKPRRRRDISQLETKIRNSVSSIRYSDPGRPRMFNPTPDQWTQIKGIWTDDKITYHHRMSQIQIIMGRPIAFWLVRDRIKVELDVDEPLVKES